MHQTRIFRFHNSTMKRKTQSSTIRWHSKPWRSYRPSVIQKRCLNTREKIPWHCQVRFLDTGYRQLASVRLMRVLSPFQDGELDVLWYPRGHLRQWRWRKIDTQTFNERSTEIPWLKNHFYRSVDPYTHLTVGYLEAIQRSIFYPTIGRVRSEKTGPLLQYEVLFSEYFHTMELDKTVEIGFSNLFLQYFQNIVILSGPIFSSFVMYWIGHVFYVNMYFFHPWGDLFLS